jgi:hypothetical protein
MRRTEAPANRLVRIVTAAIAVSALVAPAAASHCGPHPPIFVPTRISGPITPYFYPYGGHYRYHSADPVYCSLPDWHPRADCRLWRYNYLYWTC